MSGEKTKFVLMEKKEFEAYEELVEAAVKFLDSRKSNRKIARLLEQLLREKGEAEKDASKP